MTKDEALKMALEEKFSLLLWDYQELERAFEKVTGGKWVRKSNTPQRPWVGLTKEEIAEFDTWHDNREEEIGWVNPSEIVAYIEAKLKQKNGYAEEKNT